MSLLPEGWIARVAAKRIVYGIAKGVAGILTYSKAQALQQQLGISVDPETFQAGIAALMLGGLSALHDYLRVKFPNSKLV